MSHHGGCIFNAIDVHVESFVVCLEGACYQLNLLVYRT